MSGHDNASSAPQTDPAQGPKKAGVEKPRQNKVIPDNSIASTVPQNELQLDQDWYLYQMVALTLSISSQQLIYMDGGTNNET